MNNILNNILILRFLSIFIVQTWFVPDETWQVTEVAHYWSFGYGYLCWEWKEGIRTVLYPGIISIIYSFLNLVRMDYLLLLIHIPRIISALSFAFGEYLFCKLASKLFGASCAQWVAFSLSSSWFLAYCAPRTLSSCVEMIFLAMSLYCFPWDSEKWSLSTLYLTLGGIGCIVRPTMGVFLLPYCIRHLALCQHKFLLLLRYIYNVIIILILTIALDSIFFKELRIVPWNFLKFNCVSGLSVHYGTQPWHWYLTNGLLVTCGTHLLFTIYGLWHDWKKYSKLALPTVSSVVIFSCMGHKEYRFILPIVPVLLIISGNSVFNILRKCQRLNRERIRISIEYFWVIPNLLVFLYMALVHQRGPLDVMNIVQEITTSQTKSSFLFLTPCHSTPLYSHLHVETPIRFLTCEPNLNGTLNYKDEADIFFDNPSKWIQSERRAFKLDLPSHIIMFDQLAKKIGQFLNENKYKLCYKIFNAHFFDGNRGNYFHVYCKS